MCKQLAQAALLLIVTLAPAAPAPAGEAANPAVLKSEFVYGDPPPTPSCHASTIAQSGTALVAAWFGGKREGDVSVGIWAARDEGAGWSKPVEVATGDSDDGKKYPCWNPVLHQPSKGPLLLFYKVGPSPSKWWGMLITSEDAGKTWSKPRRLPAGIAGPIKDKPTELADGTLLCPSSTEDQGWRLHMEFTKDLGATWEKTGPLNDGKAFGAIQPTILKHHDGSLQLLARSRGAGKILTARSKDGGRTWSAVEPTDLANPNSGIDAVTLADGRHLLVYNNTPRGRTPLNLAMSSDGVKWQDVLALESEPGEYSYPAIVQAPDGRVHVTYTWKRQKVRHVVIDPAKLPAGR